MLKRLEEAAPVEEASAAEEAVEEAEAVEEVEAVEEGEPVAADEAGAVRLGAEALEPEYIDEAELVEEEAEPLIADQAGAQQAEISEAAAMFGPSARAGRTDMPSATAVQDRPVSHEPEGRGLLQTQLRLHRDTHPRRDRGPDEGDIASAEGGAMSRTDQELVPLFEVQPLPPLPGRRTAGDAPRARSRENKNLKQRGGVDHGE